MHIHSLPNDSPIDAHMGTLQAFTIVNETMWTFMDKFLHEE